MFRYENNILVLKGLIVAENKPAPTGHIRVYVREYFSEDFIMISDKQIKPASIEDTYQEQICMAIYYAFHDEANDAINDNAQENEVSTEITLSEELKKNLYGDSSKL